MLYTQGLVEKPVDFTRNVLVIVVPKSNPAGLNDVYDLTKPGVSIDIANPSVPVGGYTQTILKNMNLTARIMANVVSQEDDVRSVLTKIALGQADAGFVYATDARTVKGKVGVIGLPKSAQPRVLYAAAAVKSSKHLQAAKTWIHRLLTRRAQKKLRAAGFLPVPR